MSQPPHGPGDGSADRDQPPMGPPPAGMPPTGWQPPAAPPLVPGFVRSDPPSPGKPGGAREYSPWLFLSLGCGALFLIGIVLVLLIVLVFDDRAERSEGALGPLGHSGASVTGDRTAA